jgi:hypothetical protein
VTPDPDLSLDSLRRIDETTARFEAAWEGEPPPRIEAFLDGVSDPVRRALFRELLLSERELREARDDPPDVADYLARFPISLPSSAPSSGPPTLTNRPPNNSPTHSKPRSLRRPP